jgi:zinc protease
MKRTLIALWGLLSVTIALQAQPLPQDPSVRTGKLKNGMTYYIRHNAKDKGLADFYIA